MAILNPRLLPRVSASTYILKTAHTSDPDPHLVLYLAVRSREVLLHDEGGMLDPRARRSWRRPSRSAMPPLVMKHFCPFIT